MVPFIRVIIFTHAAPVDVFIGLFRKLHTTKDKMSPKDIFQMKDASKSKGRKNSTLHRATSTPRLSIVSYTPIGMCYFRLIVIIHKLICIPKTVQLLYEYFY